MGRVKVVVEVKSLSGGHLELAENPHIGIYLFKNVLLLFHRETNVTFK